MERVSFSLLPRVRVMRVTGKKVTSMVKEFCRFLFDFF